MELAIGVCRLPTSSDSNGSGPRKPVAVSGDNPLPVATDRAALIAPHTISQIGFCLPARHTPDLARRHRARVCRSVKSRETITYRRVMHYFWETHFAT